MNKTIVKAPETSHPEAKDRKHAARPLSIDVPVRKTLILVPDLTVSGGVSNYYRTLQLNQEPGFDYFVVNKGQPQSAIATAFRLVSNYFLFSFRLMAGGYTTVVVNPSLDQGRSFHRDMIFVFLSKLLRRKTVVFFRGWLDSYEEKIKKSRFKKFLFRITYARADHFVVLGNLFRKKLVGLGVPANKPFYLETTVADSSYLPELDLEKKIASFKENMVMLFLARVEKEKGLYIAIDAYRQFVARHPERRSTFLIAGDGLDLAAVKAYVAEQNIPNISFLGNVKAERKKEVLLSAHLMILPSLDGEGLPNTILEGMLYGMPVLSRVTGGIPDVVAQGKNGYLTDSVQPETFAEYLSVLAGDETKYREIAVKNHEEALEKYTSEKVKERVLKIYRHIAKR